jgi:SAM-dependent methyltransferase
MEDTATLYNTEYQFYDLFTNHGEDIELIMELAEKFPGPILELMSGTLRVAIPLAKKGFQITCLDVHPKMVQCARENLEKEDRKVRDRICIMETDVRDFDLKRRFGFIFITYNSFLHLLQGFDQVLTLRAIKKHLKDGGRLLIDVFKPDLERQQEMLDYQMSLEAMNPQGHKVVKYFSHNYDKESKRMHLTYYYDIFSGGEYKRVEVPFELHYMEHADFLDLFKRTGFMVLDVFGDYQMGPLTDDSLRMIYIVEKGKEEE